MNITFSLLTYRQFTTLIALVGMAILSSCGQENHAQITDTADSNSTELHLLDVYKSPTCGCCQFWIDHADASGFQSTIHHPQDLTQEKLQRGIGFQYHSCHTAVSEDGFVFEGHMPAKLIHQFLAEEKQDGVIGLAVPGMPIGSPGMEVGTQFSPYDVLLLKDDGSSSIYKHIATAAEQY